MPTTGADRPVLFESERLRFYRIDPVDAAEVDATCQDWESVRYTSSIPHPYPAGEALRFIESAVDKWDADTFWLMAARRKSDGIYVGQLGLTPDPDTHGQAELSYLLARPVWGQGYGTEMARAGVRYGFTVRNLSNIFARVFLENEPSNRLCQRIGMRFRHVGIVDAFARDRMVDVNFYDLARADWDAAESAAGATTGATTGATGAIGA